MHFRLTSEVQRVIESSIVSLRSARPALNGIALEGVRVEIVANGAGRVELRYTVPALGDGAFGLELARENESRVWLCHWLVGLADAPDSAVVCQLHIV